MPMTLILETDEGISEFAMKPIDRKMRRSMPKRLAIDSFGRECSRAMLTRDGLLLRSGATTDSYEDADGNSINRGEVVQTDENGNILRNLPATTGRPQRPVGPLPIEGLLEHTVVKAYVLIPMVVSHELQSSLTGGDIYRVAFRPRASVVDNPAFILANASGIFLLQCKPCIAEFIRLDQPIAMEDDMDDEDDVWDDWQMKAGADTTGGDE